MGHGGTRPELCPGKQEQPCCTQGTWVCGWVRGHGGGSQAAKHSPGPRNTSLLGSSGGANSTSGSIKGEFTTSLFWGSCAAGSSGLGLPPQGEMREKLRFREPSQAPSRKGSPGEGHFPPRCTQDLRAEPCRGQATVMGAGGQERQRWKMQGGDRDPPVLTLSCPRSWGGRGSGWAAGRDSMGRTAEIQPKG